MNRGKAVQGFKTYTKTLVGSVFGATLAIVGAAFVMVPQASAAPATCNGTTMMAGYNRERWCGFFTNTGWTDGPSLRGGTWSTTPSPGGSYTEPTAANPGVPDDVDTATEFIDMVLSDLYTGDARAVTSAQFIILAMLGVQPTVGNTVPKVVTPTQVLEWQNRVLAYANTSDTGGTASGVNGTIDWNESYHMPCGTLNTYYLIDQNDVATFFNSATNKPGCVDPLFTEEYITFRDTNGDVLLRIRRICMNPEGQITELGPIQAAADPVTEDGTVGDRIFEDNNNDGIYDPAAGDKGIPGVTVAIYRTDTSCSVDPTELVATTTTDANGNYQFTDLSVISAEGPFARYVVVVTDENGVLNTYTNTRGTEGVDNNGQNPTGYCVMLTFDSPSNQTGDFSYYKNNTPAATLANTGMSASLIIATGSILLLGGALLGLRYRSVFVK
ncbi:MAG TPA: SdrD B-like domain-containing protein [Candidatus Saccharimonadales bacterium]|nr:SdrD B-like domain-containing protein [Candidatus Saccharimonadales bacterium]